MTEQEIMSIRVYDIKGQIILSFDDVTAEKEINLESYSKGIYMVHVLSSTGRSMSKKIAIVE